MKFCKHSLSALNHYLADMRDLSHSYGEATLLEQPLLSYSLNNENS
jgi:hypothetical protein